jgi:hypothetical protein
MSATRLAVILYLLFPQVERCLRRSSACHLSGNVSAPGDSPPSSPQKKRSQVARACDWCRVHRIKCDNNRPGSNCKSRGGRCINIGEIKSATHRHAFRERERLSKRVQELELELELQKQHKVGQWPASSSTRYTIDTTYKPVHVR